MVTRDDYTEPKVTQSRFVKRRGDSLLTKEAAGTLLLPSPTAQHS